MATKADFDRIGNYALMYNKDQNIDRRRCSRTVPMQVLALGYSRTGTMSMRSALNTLGYPNTYHFSSFYENVRDCDVWQELFAAKFEGKGTVTKRQFDGLLGYCGAVTDMPCHLFAAELIAFYPDAKVVLVERELESWYRSWSGFVENALSPTLPLLAMLDPYWLGRIVGVGAAGVDKQVGSARTVTAAKARSREEYRKHYAFVRSIVPKDRLLEYQLREGWEPLCAFLEKPIPSVAFPHVNDSAHNAQSFKEIAIKGIGNILRNGMLIVAIVGVPAGAFFIWRQMSRHRHPLD
ncbi:hypothetical protein M409DRAFT_70949 [Zasmidium cellare ATCC 36951]|uniref:P-loop containing nucleoside triphosphate hydrolase protein n=1 Tax=Zasmidium cellare ATCC 36951 TaxID=1080233 RepID=A0A6A6BXD7_ZASCE|nr:uncharacterized protein M409DRAFT_70949 [Zasmidium cellare ATCC 36951]KAF2159494.1 hypothetical protein M409DRAFT_70949 [Zasmidium cellare ATCC 36951]